MGAIDRFDIQTEEERRQIRERQAQIAAEIAWELDRPRREAEERRREEELARLYSFYKKALFSSYTLAYPTLPSPTHLTHERKALIENAIESSDPQKLSLLLGPAHPELLAASLFHDRRIHRRLALYRVALHTFRTIKTLSAWEAKEALTSTAAFRYTIADKNALQQTLNEVALSYGHPLSEKEQEVFQLPTWIEVLYALDNAHLNASPEAMYVADCCRNHPPETLDESTLYAWINHYNVGLYEKKVEHYFKQAPQEKPLLENFVITKAQKGISSDVFLESAWNSYKKAPIEKKSLALQCLSKILSHTSEPLFPLNPLWIAECRYSQDKALLHLLCRQYKPMNAEDLNVRRALLKTLEKTAKIDATLSQLFNDLFDSDTWGAHFPQEMVLFPPKEQRRSLLNDNLYQVSLWPLLDVKDIKAKQAFRQERLHHWHERI